MTRREASGTPADQVSANPLLWVKNFSSLEVKIHLIYCPPKSGGHTLKIKKELNQEQKL